MDWEAAERTANVLDLQERLSCLSEGDLDERHIAAIERLRVLYGNSEGAPLSSFFAMLAHSPDFFAGYIEQGVTASVRCAIPPRFRELAILRTSWLCGAPYVWGEHVRSAGQQLLTRDEIERITSGSQSEGWTAIDAAVLRAAEELHGNAMISDATWEVLAQQFDQRQLLELPMLIGHYVTTAYVQNSLRCRLTEHNSDGLAAR